mgnify:CR=1 FL=1
MDDRIVLSLLVDNTAGVLARVAGLFSRRGYNIESLTVGVTADQDDRGFPGRPDRPGTDKEPAQ